jgi:hypothetical protein
MPLGLRLICVALPVVLLVAAALGTAPSATDEAAPPDAGLTASELEELVAPIALYPDVLIAQILPAATFPTDIVIAARWLRTKRDPAELESKTWDESVIALSHYPDVVYKMDEDLEWTNALGAAFLAQPEDVMKAIQRGRARAEALGMLQTNEQQTVTTEEDTIRILPTQTNVIYVPQYNPEVIYVDSGVSTGTVVAASAVSFGAGLALGAWLNMDCGWHNHNVFYCQPGHWYGWAHAGSVSWGVGPRRAYAVGDERGFYAGPRGAAAWGPNGGAAWRRPAVASPRPVYSGRYAGYSTRYGGQYYGGGNNQFNRQVNNINIDRGDRTAVGGDRTRVGGGDRTGIGGGDRTGIGGGDRTGIGGGDRTGIGGGDRSRGGRGPTQLPAQPSRGGQAQQLPASPSRGGQAQQLPADASRRPAGTQRSGDRTSAFDTSAGRRQTGDYSQRGQQSRDTARQSSGSARQSSGASSGRSGSSSRQSAFSSGQSGRQTSNFSSRGSSSRGGGGGGRGGGGRRGR